MVHGHGRLGFCQSAFTHPELEERRLLMMRHCTEMIMNSTVPSACGVAIFSEPDMEVE